MFKEIITLKSAKAQNKIAKKFEIHTILKVI